MRAFRLALVVALFASVLALLAWRASVKPFWHDEIYTILEAELPVATLWRALHDGIDLQPPLNALLTRGIHLLVGPGPIATRLPAIGGFLLAAVFTFIIVRRRTNGLIATAAVLLLCTTPAWGNATDARGYGLTFGAFAIAMFAWTEAAAGRHPTRNWILLAVSLAAGIWAHYYFVLALVPIGVGEITRQVRLKRFMPQPWLAMAASVVLTAPLWPLAAAASAQRSTFWAVPTWNVEAAYRYIARSVFSDQVMIVILGVLAAVEIARRVRARRWPRVIASHEIAAAVGCLAIPLVGILLGQLIGAFYVGYITFAAVGFAMVLPTAAWACFPENKVGDVLLAGAMVIAMFPVVNRTLADRGPLRDATQDHPLVVDWLRGEEPIIFSSGLSYLEIWYALPENLRPRFLYLADPQGARRDTDSDTVEVGYLALARWTDLPVVPLGEYVAAHPHFWLYTIDRNATLLTLREMGAQVTLHGQERRRYGRRRLGYLYEIRMPPK
jgi:hypothetical protein